MHSNLTDKNVNTKSFAEHAAKKKKKVVRFGR